MLGDSESYLSILFHRELLCFVYAYKSLLTVQWQLNFQSPQWYFCLLGLPLVSAGAAWGDPRNFPWPSSQRFLHEKRIWGNSAGATQLPGFCVRWGRGPWFITITSWTRLLASGLLAVTGGFCVRWGRGPWFITITSWTRLLASGLLAVTGGIPRFYKSVLVSLSRGVLGLWRQWGFPN
jgi:hypothetical protein